MIIEITIINEYYAIFLYWQIEENLGKGLEFDFQISVWTVTGSLALKKRCVIYLQQYACRVLVLE